MATEIQRISQNPQILQNPSVENQKQIPSSKPIYEIGSSIAICSQDNPTTVSKKASAFSAKPVLAPPKELIIKASETVEIFIQAKPLDNRKIQTIEVEEEPEEDPELRGQKAQDGKKKLAQASQAADMIIPQLNPQQKPELVGIVAKKNSDEPERHDQIGSPAFSFEEDEDPFASIRLKNNRLFLAKVGKNSIKDLLALVSEKEADAEEDLSQENQQDDAAVKELRKQDANVKEKSFDPDRESLMAISEQRGLHRVHSLLAFDEIKNAKEFSTNLNREMNKLYESINKRRKGAKILGWVGKIANIASGGSAIIVAAVTLATGGIGGFLAVIPASAQLLSAGAKLGEGVMSMQNQSDQANLTEIQAVRELVKSKMYDLLAESQKANKIQQTLWRTSSDIAKNMARVNTYSPSE